MRFIAFEGFAKLLLNKSIQNDDVLFKIFLTYLTSDQEKQSKQAPDHKELKSCLRTFLYFYFRKYPSQLVKTVDKFIKYGLEKKIGLKACASYASFMLSVLEKPQLKYSIINMILDTTIPNIGDFRVTQRLTIALLEFRVYDSEIDEADSYSVQDSKYFFQLLNEMATKLQKLTVSKNFDSLFYLTSGQVSTFLFKTLFRAQKWKLPQEPELRELARNVSRLNDRCVKAKSGLKRVRPVSMIKVDDDSNLDTSCSVIEESDAYEFPASRPISKPKASKRS